MCLFYPLVSVNILCAFKWNVVRYAWLQLRLSLCNFVFCVLFCCLPPPPSLVPSLSGSLRYCSFSLLAHATLFLFYIALPHSNSMQWIFLFVSTRSIDCLHFKPKHILFKIPIARIEKQNKLYIHNNFCFIYFFRFVGECVFLLGNCIAKYFFQSTLSRCLFPLLVISKQFNANTGIPCIYQIEQCNRNTQIGDMGAFFAVMSLWTREMDWTSNDVCMKKKGARKRQEKMKIERSNMEARRVREEEWEKRERIEKERQWEKGGRNNTLQTEQKMQ